MVRVRAAVLGSVLSSFVFVFALPTAALAATFGPNLIPNPSLATAGSPASVPANWKKGGYGTNDRVLTYPVDGYDASPGAQVRMTSRTSGDAKWYFTHVPAEAGQSFVFSDYYKSNVETALTVQILLEDGSARYLDLDLYVPASDVWTKTARTFTVPSYASSPVSSVTVFHLLRSVGTLTTDNFDLRRSDSTPPVVRVAALPTEAILGTVTLAATATDGSGVASVQFFADGSPVGTADGSPPYMAALDTTVLSDGLHYATARAVDVAGNVATSPQVAFYTRNHSETQADAGITVYLIVVNDNGGTQDVDDFPLLVDNINVENGEEVGVSAGTYVVSQIADPQYSVTYQGDCDSEGQITVSSGQHRTCTIVNDDIAPEIDPQPSNVIPNPSVETTASNRPVGWSKGSWGTNSVSYTYPVAGHSGAKALRTDITSYVSGDAKWYFGHVPARSGDTYVYSDFYKSNIVSSVTVQYLLQDGSYRYDDLSRGVPASPSWAQFVRTFAVPAYPSAVVSMTVFHVISGTGWLVTDDFALSPQTASPGPASNLVANPDFDDASGSPPMPDLWAKAASPGTEATFTYPAAGRDGGPAARIDVTEYNSGSGAKWYFRSVAVEGGKEYQFTDWYKSSANSVVTAQFQFDDGTYGYMELARLTPSPDWKQLEKYFHVPERVQKVTVLHLIQAEGSLTIDTVALRTVGGGAFSKAMISLHFDDGLQSVYDNALPILDEYGFKSSQYIVTQYFGFDAYVSAAQVQSMRDAGHEIGSHTRTHAHLTQLTASQANAQISGSKSDLAALGIAVDSFAYPFGEFDDAIEDMVRDAGYRGARSIREGLNTKNTDPYALYTLHVESNTPIARIREWIDEAIRNKRWLILEFHAVDDSGIQYSATPAFLRQVADYIELTGIETVSTSQGLAAMGH